MATITISRQMGSLGRQIAGMVSVALGYRMIWREVINQAANRSRTPEVALATIDELDLLGLRPAPADVHAYHQAVRELMFELAEQGGMIIVGRAGQAILHGVKDVLHVRIYAPVELRIERIANQNGITLQMAKAQVETSDESRRRYLRRYYHARWDDPDLYDVMLNTATLTPETASAVICEALHRRSEQPYC